jgi:hypothetical protein
MNTFPRPPPVARETMTISEFISREAQLRRVRDLKAKPVVAHPTCHAPNDARLGPGPALACALPNGRLIKRKARDATRWTVVGRMGPSATAADLANVAIRIPLAPVAGPPAAQGVARRYMGFEDDATALMLPESVPPVGLTDTLTNAEMRQFFPAIDVRAWRYSIAEVARIMEVLVDASGRKDLLVQWNDSVPAARNTRVHADEVRGGAEQVARFLATRERARVDTSFFDCEPTGRTRVDEGGQTELEVTWDVDGSVGWAKEGSFL